MSRHDVNRVLAVFIPFQGRSIPPQETSQSPSIAPGLLGKITNRRAVGPETYLEPAEKSEGGGEGGGGGGHGWGGSGGVLIVVVIEFDGVPEEGKGMPVRHVGDDVGVVEMAHLHRANQLHVGAGVPEQTNGE